MKTSNDPLHAHGVPAHPFIRPSGTLARSRRRAALAAAGALTIAAVLAGCSSTGSASLAVPSVNASAAASLGAQVALTALDRVDTAIASAQTSGGLSAENATTLKNLSASVRTALQSGDMTAAKSAFDQFSAKATEVTSGMSGDSAKAVQDAIAAVKAALGS